MPATSNFAWDFERPTPAYLNTFDTFSVGIFQWLPKKSGKDLKKSKAMSRVLGYTAEPDRVFEKALVLCARLNRESASAQAPPDWLQKQYSVPRPENLVVVRLSDDFTGAQVRAMRLKVMKELLLPAGFIKGQEATYVRRKEDQIHLIDFQASKYGHEFTVNLGFHYAFVPPLFHRDVTPLAEFHLLDCVWRTRIGQFLPAKRETWFEYGNNREKLIKTLRLCATTCLDTFDNLATQWRDPAALLKQAAKFGVNELGLAWIALKTDRPAEAERRLKQCQRDHLEWLNGRPCKPLDEHTLLESRIAEYHKLAKKGAKNLPWKDWVS